MAFLPAGVREKGWSLLPIAAAFAGNLRSLRGDFVWDDNLFVERSAALGVSGGAFLEYYRPICSVLGAMLYGVAGSERPWAWHLASVVIHAAAAAGVYRLLRRWVDASEPHAAAGATLFALWPASVEAISWVSACSELLMGCFLVWGLVFHLRAQDRGSVAIGAALLHLAALLSKEVGVVFLPLAVAATFLVPAPPGAMRPRWIRLFGPHVAVLAIYTVLRAGAVGPGSSLIALAADRLRPEAIAPALYAWGWYVREGLLLGPGSPFVESPVISALTWAFALGGLFAFARALDVARRPGNRPIGLAAIWFAVALAPPLAFASAPVSITPVASRYLYVPSIALFALATLALGRLRRGSRGVRLLAAGAVCVLLLAMGWSRQSPWLSDVALWSRAVKDNPRSSVAQLNLGFAEIAAGDVSTGEAHLRMAAWNPAVPDGSTRQSMLARVSEYYRRTQRPDLAYEALTLAVRMEGTPATNAQVRASALSLASVWYDLGTEQQERADFAKAAEAFGRAIELAPDWSKPYLPRGLALESAGDLRGAAATYEAFLVRFEEPSASREQVTIRLHGLRR